MAATFLLPPEAGKQAEGIRDGDDHQWLGHIGRSVLRLAVEQQEIKVAHGVTESGMLAHPPPCAP